MNSKTLKALNASVKKWKKISKGLAPTKGSDDCPLCALFLIPKDVILNGRAYNTETGKFEYPIQQCQGCPIQERTKISMCKGTPYYDIGQPLGILTDPKDLEAATAFVNFLKSLLPEVS